MYTFLQELLNQDMCRNVFRDMCVLCVGEVN